MRLDTAFTIKPMELGKKWGISPEEMASRPARLNVIERALTLEFFKYEPVLVASESPFLGRFPAAFAALVECVTVERRALRAYDSNKRMCMLTPTTVKVGAGVAHNSNDKEDMRDALDNIEDVDLSDVDISSLDEHAIDAIHVTRAAIAQAYGLLLPYERKKKAKKGKRRKKADAKPVKEEALTWRQLCVLFKTL